MSATYRPFLKRPHVKTTLTETPVGKERAYFGVRFFIVFAVSVLACSEGAYTPEDSNWRRVANFPDVFSNETSLTALGVTVFIAGAVERNTGSFAAIYKCNGTTLEPLFISANSGSFFYDIGGADGAIWATGTKAVGKPANNFQSDIHEPYIVEYDGSRFKEVSGPPNYTRDSFYQAIPARGGICWFNGGDVIFIYENGQWRKTFDAYDDDTLELDVSSSGRAWLYQYDIRVRKGYLHISDDDGRTWSKEEVRLDGPGYAVPFYEDFGFAAAGGTVYIRLPIKGTSYNDDVQYDAILKRDGPPGGGTYKIVFFAPHGPNFYQIKSMAFKSAEDGFGVGALTSVHLENGRWYLEDVSQSDNSFLKVACGDSYWALMESTSGGPLSLWRSP